MSQFHICAKSKISEVNLYHCFFLSGPHFQFWQIPLSNNQLTLLMMFLQLHEYTCKPASLSLPATIQGCIPQQLIILMCSLKSTSCRETFFSQTRLTKQFAKSHLLRHAISRVSCGKDQLSIYICTRPSPSLEYVR